jgi:hypothetical protein
MDPIEAELQRRGLLSGGATSPPVDDPVTQELIRRGLTADGFNQPTGEARSGNAGPMPTAGGIVDDPERGASMATIARASLAPDTADQIRRFAAARFPSLPVDEAVKRYGVDRDGNIIFADPVTGQLVREVPTMGRGAGVSDTFMRAGYQVASGAGPAIPAVAAGVVGAAMGPTGMSIPAAGVAAGGADLARQAIDRYFAGEDPTNLNYWNAAGQAGMNAAGQGAGVLLNKMLQRNPLGVQPYDRLKARDPAEQQRWRELYDEAQRRGVDLSVGEASNLRSIRAQERALRTFPETTDKFDDFIRNRNTNQVPAAVRSELDRIAPARNVAEGADMLRQGADDVLSGMVKKRTAAASPHYQAAFGSGVEPDISPVLQDIESRLAKVGEATPTGRGLRAMLNALTQEERVVDAAGNEIVRRVPLRNYEVLHSVKEQFDDIVSGAFDVQQTSAAKRAARDLAGVKAELADVLKSAHPGYAQGAQVYASMSAPIQDARNGALKALLDKEGPASIRYAEALFDAAKDIPPTEIHKIRQLYTAAGKQDEWLAGVRSFLADRLDTALQINASGEPGGVPGKFVKSVWGTGNQQEILKAALGDQQLVTSFGKLMDVLTAAARSLPEGSPTAANLAAQQAMMQPGKAARFIGKATSPGTLLSLGDDVVEGLAALRRPGQRIALADHLLSPEGMAQLRRMTLLSPTSQKAIDIASLILTDAGIIGGTKAMNPPPPRMPDQTDPLP